MITSDLNNGRLKTVLSICPIPLKKTRIKFPESLDNFQATVFLFGTRIGEPSLVFIKGGANEKNIAEETKLR